MGGVLDKVNGGADHTTNTKQVMRGVALSVTPQSLGDGSGSGDAGVLVSRPMI